MPSSPAAAALASVCPQGWQVLPLADVAYFQEGPGILAKDFRDSGVPLLRLKGVEGDYVTLDGCNYLDPEMVARKWNHFRVDVGDLLISTSASLGRVSVVTNESAGGIPYTGLIRFRPKDPRLLAGYLKAFLGSAAFVEQAESMASGSVIRHFGPSHIRQMAILLPPLDQQTQIGRLASLLDERLRLLRQTNATLESIAQALFKSWFIDFEPVRAKAEGRDPKGLDAATAALFPAEFEESALGRIPKGWGVGSILDTANLLSGGTPKTDNPDYWGGSILWASAKDVSQSPGSVLVGTERTITETGLVKSSTRLIPALATAIVARGATTGRMVMFGREMAMNQTCYALTSRCDAPVVLHLLLRKAVSGLLNAAHGSVFDTITTSTFAQSRCVLAPPPLQLRLEGLVRPMFERIAAGVSQAQNLASIRDALLPRLVSGKLRLPEAQEQVEDALA